MLRVMLAALLATGCGGKVAADAEEAGTVLRCTEPVIEDDVPTRCPKVVPAVRTARQTFEAFEPDLHANLGEPRVSMFIGGDVAGDGTGHWFVSACSESRAVSVQTSSSECAEILSCTVRCDPPFVYEPSTYVDSDVAVRAAFPSDPPDTRYDLRLLTDPYASRKVSWLVMRRRDSAEHTVDAVTGILVH